MGLVLVLVLKDSLRTYFKSLSLSWSLGVKSLSLGGQVKEVLVLVLGGQVLVLVLGGQVLVLVLGGQVLVNIPAACIRLLLVGRLSCFSNSSGLFLLHYYTIIMNHIRID